MGGREPPVPEEHLAEVHAVAQDGEDELEAPWFAAAGSVPMLVQPVGDVASAESPVQVQVEHHRHERCLVRVDLQEAGLPVNAIAPGHAAAIPSAPGSFALHAGNDAVDDRGPFELGEDAEHLDHHETRGRAGVEWLGRGPEDASGPVQIFENLRQATY
ncbi:MAG TPA: hypothetical protein VKI99_13665 [Candidatus Dormibacteraeota bacterium]|nr:hypothetical protein [Candidatus Dormibacteraeota bacterium]